MSDDISPAILAAFDQDMANLNERLTAMQRAFINDSARRGRVLAIGAGFHEAKRIITDGETTLDIVAGLIVAAVVRLSEQTTRTVDTPEQLAALPFLSVIREVFRKSPSGTNYGAVYERRTSGWECIAGAWKDSPDNGSPRLPCRVLWNPEEDDR